MIPGADPTHPDADLVRTPLRDLYEALGADIDRLGPSCALSGRCCRFAEYGHTLFVSAPEFALLLADAPPPVRPLDGGLTCPWQDDLGRCTARDARPLGCRVYYCDPSYEPRGYILGETYVGRLKALCRDRGLAWDYAPLHHHLRRARDEGQFADPPSMR